MRALTPHIGAYLELEGGERLGVRRGAPSSGVDAGRRASRVGGAAGRLRDGALRLEVVQPAGGKAMAADDYLRGRPVPSSMTCAEHAG